MQIFSLHVQCLLCLIVIKLDLSRQSVVKPRDKNFMKICPVEAEFFHMGGHWTDREKANSCFFQLCRCT